MTGGTVEAGLRGMAVAIAVAALIDPGVAVERTPMPTVVVVNASRAGVAEVAEALRPTGAEVTVRTPDHGRVPCEPGERCVVVADGSTPTEVPGDLGVAVSVVTAGPPAAPNVAVESVTVGATHAAAAGVIRVVVDGRGVATGRTEVRVRDGQAVVGAATVEWSGDGRRTLDVPWWPLGSGVRVLRIEAVHDGSETAGFDNVADLPVRVEASRIPVLVFDARPSWQSTFVRRALEDDPRFQVDYRARLAPALAAATAGGRLDAAALNAVPVVVAGGPDALTAADVDLLERYVRVRGGTLILLPERVPSGSHARLFGGRWREELAPEPRPSGPLLATERLVPLDVAPSAVTLSDVVVATPMGEGRVIVSGAMDAWRYRDAEAGAFDRFWRSVAAEGAVAGAGVQIEFTRDLAAPAARASFVLKHRSMTPGDTATAAVVARCGDGAARTVRVWPVGAMGLFRGELAVGAAMPCEIEADVNDVRTTSGIAVMRDAAMPVSTTLTNLERAARRSGGIVTDRDNLAPLVARLTEVPAPPTVVLPVHPMRSAWWLLPFAAGLSIEWWRRRWRGLR